MLFLVTFKVNSQVRLTGLNLQILFTMPLELRYQLRLRFPRYPQHPDHLPLHSSGTQGRFMVRLRSLTRPIRLPSRLHLNRLPLLLLRPQRWDHRSLSWVLFCTCRGSFRPSSYHLLSHSSMSYHRGHCLRSWTLIRIHRSHSDHFNSGRSDRPSSFRPGKIGSTCRQSKYLRAVWKWWTGSQTCHHESQTSTLARSCHVDRCCQWNNSGTARTRGQSGRGCPRGWDEEWLWRWGIPVSRNWCTRCLSWARVARGGSTWAWGYQLRSRPGKKSVYFR